ncbi:HAMP domain-containing histidine kinase [bacterium]|nr:HAMP domain-containing histidine kinase [bacterium]
MERLELRLLLWSLLLTAVFGGVFLLVARLDPYPVQQLYQLRCQVRAAQRAYGMPPQPEPVMDSGRANLPPYIGRGRSEMFFGVAMIALLGAFGTWRLARPIERPLRHLADSCRALQLGEAWTSPPARGPLQTIGQDFALMLDNLRNQEQQLKEATHNAQQALVLREKLLGRSYAEFRPPLLAMRQSLKGLAPHPYLHTLERNLDVLLQLVDDLARKPEPPQLLEVELGAWLRESLAELDARITLLESAPALARLDPLRTRQALLNLVANALKFSDLEVTVSWGGPWIMVEDQGPGFDNRKVPEMVQEFRQLDSGDSGGVGLGLATTQRWMELQGGRLELDSEPGRGTRARLVFAPQ